MIKFIYIIDTWHSARVLYKIPVRLYTEEQVLCGLASCILGDPTSPVTPHYACYNISLSIYVILYYLNYKRKDCVNLISFRTLLIYLRVANCNDRDYRYLRGQPDA